MLRKLLMLTTIVLVFSACEVQAAVIHSTWVGGEQVEWGNANNWNPAIVPDNDGDDFDVTINGGTGWVDVRLQQSRTINKLTCYGGVELGSWAGCAELTLEYAMGLRNYGELEIDELDINSNITNTAGAYLELFDLDINGNLYNHAGAMLEIGEEVCLESETTGHGNLENSGTILIVPDAGLNVPEGKFNNLGEILIYGGECSADEEILDNNDTGVIQGFGVVFANQLQNKGKIYAYGGSLAVVSGGPFLNSGILANYALSSLHIKPAENVNNLGTIEVNAGGGVAFDCNLVNESNGIIKLLGGTLAATTITQTADANFAGFGGITGDVVIDPNGIIKLSGPTNIVGDVMVEHNAVLEISDGQTLIVGHTANNGEIRVVNGDVVFQGGYSGNGVVNKD